LKLSVLIPCFNTGKFLEKCVDSLLVGWPDIEIIIIDDGSTDNTWETMRNIEDDYPTVVKIFRNDTNIGIGRTLDRCVGIATGEYIFFMGSDDYLSGNFLNFAHEQAHNGIEAIGTMTTIEDISGKKIAVGKLLLPIFHRKHVIIFGDWPKDLSGVDRPQEEALKDVEVTMNSTPDYHYVRWDGNFTANHHSGFS